MRAEVTYNGGSSYRFMQYSQRFLKGKTEIVMNDRLIQLAQRTPGFAINILDRGEAPVKKRRVLKKKRVLRETVSTKASKKNPTKAKTKKVTAKKKPAKKPRR